jgi:hypothetical protein
MDTFLCNNTSAPYERWAVFMWFLLKINILRQQGIIKKHILILSSSKDVNITYYLNSCTVIFLNYGFSFYLHTMIFFLLNAYGFIIINGEIMSFYCGPAITITDQLIKFYPKHIAITQIIILVKNTRLILSWSYILLEETFRVIIGL